MNLTIKFKYTSDLEALNEEKMKFLPNHQEPLKDKSDTEKTSEKSKDKASEKLSGVKGESGEEKTDVKCESIEDKSDTKGESTEDKSDTNGESTENASEDAKKEELIVDSNRISIDSSAK